MNKKFFLLFLFYITKIHSECIPMADNEKLIADVKENFKLEFDLTNIVNGSIKKTFEKQTEYIQGFECGKDELALCENFISKYDFLIRDNKDKILCYEFSENCEITRYVIVKKLKNDIFKKVDLTNSYELMMKYVNGLVTYLLDSFDTNLFPIDDEENKNDNKEENENKNENEKKNKNDENNLWTDVGYLISNNNIMYTFPLNINLDKIEEDEEIIQKSIKSFFIFFKQIFYQAKPCFDIKADFRKLKNKGLINALTIDKFPQSDSNTINWVVQNVEGDNNFKHQVIMKFYVVAHCMDEIVYGDTALNNLVRLLGDDQEKNMVLTNKKEIKAFEKYFITDLDTEKQNYFKALLKLAKLI